MQTKLKICAPRKDKLKISFKKKVLVEDTKRSKANNFPVIYQIIIQNQMYKIECIIIIVLKYPNYHRFSLLIKSAIILVL